jgi:PKD repeat protein
MPGAGQNATMETSNPVFSHTFPAAGAYYVALTVMNADGTSYGTAHLINAGFSAPTAAFSGTGGVEGAPIAFSGAGSTDPNAGGALSYAWNFGDGSTASGATVSHAFHAGFYTVLLTVTDSASGLTNSVSHGVFILDEGPSASFNAPAGRAGTPLAFSGSGSDPDGSITSYSWNFGDGASASGASPRHAYAHAGTYTVILRVGDSGGQSASVSHTIIVTPMACVVPRIKGDGLAKARTLLASAHCSLGKFKTPGKPKRSPGRHKKWVLVVAGEKPGPGTVKANGAKVTITLTWKAVHS